MDSAHVGGQDQRFRWTRLYQAIADKLLNYRNDRSPLIRNIHGIAERVGSLSVLQDRFADGSTGPLDDICPFTTMATFNRGVTAANKLAVVKELAEFLGVDIPIPDADPSIAPDAFPGIPVVINQKTWFFGYSKDRNAGDFHPNLSYEDFVRGWRPVGDGKLALADGVFMEAIRAASANPSAKYVVVIEEINRGNPAQIFGELLTLLEADKRSPRDAVELCYPDPDGTRRPVHVPKNVYVIGTMNIADRSLALVDLALRRRFAFVTLEPSLGAAWSNWVVRECGIDPELVDELRRRIGTLNDRIATDDQLGSQFQVGHSYVTPTYRLESGATRDWFRQVVETELQPLLEEYWFDSPTDAREAVQQLLEGW